MDGDLVDSSHVTNRSKASPDNLHIWGTSRQANDSAALGQGTVQAISFANYFFCRARSTARVLGVGGTEVARLYNPDRDEGSTMLNN